MIGVIDAFRIRNHGSASELKLKRGLEIGSPQDYHILVKHTVVGVNRFDLEVMRGDYFKTLPMIPGLEIIGVVEQIGRGVANFQKGDRLAFWSDGFGGLAEKSIVHMKKCVPIPNYISDEIAGAGYFKGSFAITALTRVFSAYKGAKIVVLGAAGGIGHMLTQLASKGECKVIGVVSSQSKAQIALENGCSKAFILSDEDLSRKIIDYAGGYGVHAVFDPIFSSVTVKLATKILDIFGMYVPYGQGSGEKPRINIEKMGYKSIYITRPNIFNYQGSPLLLQDAASQTFDLIKRGLLQPKIKNAHTFKNAAKMYKDMEAGELTCSNLIIMS